MTNTNRTMPPLTVEQSRWAVDDGATKRVDLYLVGLVLLALPILIYQLSERF